ncbi:MAG TPA: FAD-dependent oxidoreductase [Solirubrobacteraceae bacterium]|nr:FAD-dependent oxidoreductase [Solirubrobacteraceae bacterium]
MAAPAHTPVWGDPAGAENPGPLRGPVSADVCVVGLGGSGLAAVGAALAAGASVVGVDAGPVAGGAAGRNGGFLLAGGALFHNDAVAAWGEERAVGIYQESLRELDRLEAELGAPIVRRVGSLRIPASPEEEQHCADQLAMLRRHDLPAEPAEGPTGRGLFVPTDGSVQPLDRCRLLARRAAAAGARLHCGSTVTELSGTRVRTADGEIECKAVVACVDGGIEVLFPELAGRARSARLQMLATAPVEPRFPSPVYDNHGYDYWQQLPDGRVALGGGRSLHADAEWELPPEPGDDVQAYLDVLLRERLGIDAPVTHRWAGRIAYTPSRLPVFEELRPGVMVVGAHSGHGNVLGSAAGRSAMAMALGGPADRLAELLG